MNKKRANIFVLYLQLNISELVLTSANVVHTPQKSLECECYKGSQGIHNSQDECKDNVVKCSDAERISSCFVLWTNDNVTGKFFE